MKIRITKNHVDALCVLIGVLGMGSLYFQVLRMPLMAAMLIASILLLTRAHHPKISAQNVRLTLLLTAALLLTSFVNPQNGIHINDIVIWLCNIGYVLVLQSCIGYRTYMRLYTKVMLAEAAISLISFVIGDLLSLPLPLLRYDAHAPEDVDTRQEDHIADEIRYLCQSDPIAPRPAVQRTPQVFDPLSN